MDDGWSQFSSFLGGGLGVFQPPQPSPTTTRAPGIAQGVTRSTTDGASQRAPASALKNPLRQHASDVPSSSKAFFDDGAAQTVHDTGYPLTSDVDGFMGTIGAPCVPSRDITPAYMTVRKSSTPSSASENMRSLDSRRNPGDHAAPSMQKPLGKLRASDQTWTVVNDEPSKPKGQIAPPAQVCRTPNASWTRSTV